MQQSSTGFQHFLDNADSVSQGLMLILLAMSVATWFLIVKKAWNHRVLVTRGKAFLAMFWNAKDMHEVAMRVDQEGARDPFSHLTHHALRAARQYSSRSGQRMIESGSADELLTRALRRALDQDTARLEYGQTVLASVASSAPFIGLFGTVWGIYHALLAIGASTQSNLEMVAAPVGEALIMTAFGLAVAIPSVLAFNAFSRLNRMLLSELDGFAHDVFAFMSTGIRGDASQSVRAGKEVS